MSTTAAPTDRRLTPLDLASLLYLGVVWGGAFLFLRIAAPEVGPVWAAEFRLAIGAVILLALAGRRALPAMRGRVIAFTIVGATFAAIPFTCIAFASLTLPTGFTALLNAATPLFTAALGVLVLRQALTPRMVAGLTIGVVAVLVLVGWSHLDVTPATLIAVAAGLGAPASYAVAGTYVRARLSDVPGVELATGMILMGALVTLPVAFLSGAPGTPTPGGAVSLLAVGSVSTAFAWPVFYRILGRSTPTVASTVTFIVPVFAAAWGALVLGEAVGSELIVAFGLVLVSLGLVLNLRPAVPQLVLRGVAAVRHAASPA
ncbi:MAG TPA: DMT family transporter [Candidatus Limnocylindrales bacterium]|jgi:drug/metabolite transporter (DMT)-like permease|nr:DMT family transporter [Candidatus Limnocylindrales bacterium]